MKIYSATEAKNQLSMVMEQAIKEPVSIEKNGRPYVVIVSAEDYNEQLKMKRRGSFIKLCEDIASTAKENGMTEQVLQSILAESE